MLLAATDSDEVNLIACLLARNLNPYILKVARVRNPEYLEEKELFGPDLLGIDQIINPESVMVATIRNLMLVPEASDVIDFVDGKIKLVGITVKPDSPLTGRQLLSFKETGRDILVGAILRGDQVIIPRGEDTIRAGDLLYAVVRTDELNSIFKAFGIKDKELKRVIIVGAGQTGVSLATALDKDKVNVKIIDRDAQRCSDLAQKLERVTVIHGDGRDKDLLQEENIDGLDLLVALTGDEESNVLISLLAKGMGAKKIITRINKMSYIPIVSAIGLDTVISSRLSAIRAFLQYLRRGRIISVVPLKGEHAEAIEAEALETSDIIDVPLSKVKLPSGSLIGAIVRGDEVIIPDGSHEVKAGDRLIIFALQKALPKLEKLLTVKPDFF
jgi:trk system potassium uptake protein TrkA